MIDPQEYTLTADATQEVEDQLARFERDRSIGSVSLSDYTPPTNDVSYGAVLTELARIDLEHSFGEGRSSVASSYIEAFPDVFCKDHFRTQLAFEEFRLRRRYGQDISSAKVAEMYDVNGNGWPKIQLGSEKPYTRSASPELETSPHPTPTVHYPRVGETIAGYPLVHRLGEGAHSRVFLARQPDLVSRLVVLKVTPQSTEESDQLAQLQHTNIIPIFSIHLEKGLSCICMPFLGSTTLADLSARSDRWTFLDGPAEELVSTILERKFATIHVRSGDKMESKSQLENCEPNDIDCVAKKVASLPIESLTPAHAGLTKLLELNYSDAFLSLVIGAVDGLAHAHERGIIHRDLKPANILITDDGRSVLLDFNLAVSAEEGESRLVGGTLPYMSPQQLEAIETSAPADTRDDVFSVGVVLYEILSGELPFRETSYHGSRDLERMISQRQKPPVPLCKKNARLAPGLESIVNRCLAANREGRYRHAGELLEDLTRQRDHLPLLHAPNVSWKERFLKWIVRNPRISSASTVASVAAIVLGLSTLVVLQRGQRIERLGAYTKYQQFLSAYPDAVMALSTPGREPDILASGLMQSAALMTQWNVCKTPLTADGRFARLGEQEQRTISQRLARLAYLMAAAKTDQLLQSNPSKMTAEKQAALRWNQLAIELDSSLKYLATYQRNRMLARLGDSTAEINSVFDLPRSTSPGLGVIVAADARDAESLHRFCSAQLESQPTDVIAWFNLATADWHLGNLDEAIAGYGFCDRMHPRSYVTLFNRGLCYLDRGKPDEAFSDFTACLRIRPGSLTSRFNRAVAMRNMGDLPASLQELDVVIASDQASTRMVLLRRQIHAALGNEKQAAADLESAMRIQPRDANDWVALGVSQLASSPDVALKSFQSALKINSTHYSAMQNIAHVYAERLAQPERAIDFLDRLISLRPQAASPIASRGILHARLKRFQAAEQDARLAAMLSPTGLEQLQIAGIYALASDGTRDTVELTNQHARKMAVQFLSRALRSNASLAKLAVGDADLANLRNDAEFRRLITSAILLLEKSQ